MSPKPPQYVQTKNELAAVLRLTRQALGHWTKQQGFPQKTKQGWNVAACLEFHRQALQDRAASRGQDGSEKAQLQCEKLKREIERIDLDIAHRKGELVDRADMMAVLFDFCGMGKMAAKAFTENVEAEVSDAGVVTRCRELADKFLRDLDERMGEESD